MGELKKCPFCGGEAEILRYGMSLTSDVKVFCAECHASTGKFHKTREEAIAAWNIRKPMERIQERLEEECKKPDAVQRIYEKLLDRYQLHHANIKKYMKNNDFDSASRESLMKTECEIAIEIVEEEP